MLLTRKELIAQGEDPDIYITKEEFEAWKECYLHSKSIEPEVDDEEQDICDIL